MIERGRLILSKTDSGVADFTANTIGTEIFFSHFYKTF